MYLQGRSLAVPQWNRLTFLRKMIIETVCSAFGEDLATRFACVLIAITGIVELGTAFEELEDERVGFSAHFGSIGTRHVREPFHSAAMTQNNTMKYGVEDDSHQFPQPEEPPRASSSKLLPDIAEGGVF